MLAQTSFEVTFKNKDVNNPVCNGVYIIQLVNAPLNRRNNREFVRNQEVNIPLHKTLI